jgi:hypothetical protein
VDTLSKKIFWAKTGNFPTLLCLGDQIARFGPVRLYWEGTRERYIQELKTHLLGMRRNPDYFGGKLCLMYRTNVMNWIREEMNRFKNDDDTDLEFGRKPRMYYQYKTLDQIEKRIKFGVVISGFTLAGDDDRIMVTYGTKRRSGLMNCISISRLDRESSRKCLGLAYVTCKLDEQVETLFAVEVKAVEEIIGHYCLLLPLVENHEFTGKYAVIYEDWDVGDEYFKKYLPSIYSLLFKTNVLP